MFVTKTFFGYDKPVTVALLVINAYNFLNYIIILGRITGLWIGSSMKDKCCRLFYGKVK